MDKYEAKVKTILDTAGVEFNTSEPSSINVLDNRFYKRVLLNGSLGLGESYMEGWWECQRIDELIFKILRSKLNDKVYNKYQRAFTWLLHFLLNQQSRRKSKRVIDQHYNIDNDLYIHMLGKTMAYTCAYWNNAQSLDEAQYNKLNLICKKLDIQPGDTVLELGCGFGGFAKFAAEKYGCRVTAVNISEEQVKYAREFCKGLPVEIYLCDYRDPAIYNPNKIKFNKIVSIGMLEHVGEKNYRTFLNIAASCIQKNGLFLLHSIIDQVTGNGPDPWYDKYIFPGAYAPSVKTFSGFVEEFFVIEDLHNIGAHYDRTLMEWYKNINANWDNLVHRYDDKFKRMWNFYLLCSAGASRARTRQLGQWVFSSDGLVGGYTSVR